MKLAYLKYFALLSFFAIVDIVTTYYIKYSSTGLGINEFSIFKIGNMLNLIMTVLFLLGLIVLMIQRDKLQIIHFRIIIIFSILYLLPLLGVLIIKFTNWTFPDQYFLSYPYKKIIPGALFIANKLILLYLLVLVWNFIFVKRVFVYLGSLFITLIILAIIILSTYFYNISFRNYDVYSSRNSFKVGVILGAAVWSSNEPSPLFTRRIDKGFELYKLGKIKKIQLTGGNAPGEISEAKAALNLLNDKYKIPRTDIYIEEWTSTTSEQIRFIKEELIGKLKIDTVLIISDNFHLKRVLEIADFFNVNAYGISSEYELNWEKLLFYRFRDSVGLLLFWFLGI